MDISARQGVLVLSKRLGDDQFSSPLNFVLMNDDEKEAAQESKRNQVRPEVAVFNRLFEQNPAALINAPSKVPVGGIHALQSKIK